MDPRARLSDLTILYRDSVAHAGVLDTTPLPQGIVLRAATGREKGKQSPYSEESGMGKGPPRAQVQLLGPPAVTSFQGPFPTISIASPISLYIPPQNAL